MCPLEDPVGGRIQREEWWISPCRARENRMRARTKLHTERDQNQMQSEEPRCRAKQTAQGSIGVVEEAVGCR